jgi:hypothetical protein
MAVASRQVSSQTQSSPARGSWFLDHITNTLKRIDPKALSGIEVK